MDVQDTLRKLRSEKKWFDQVIASLEVFQRSKPVQAVALLDFYLARKREFTGSGFSLRNRRRLARWLRECGGNGRGPTKV